MTAIYESLMNISNLPAWKIIFESLWKTFNLRFQSILDSLRKHRDLIDQEANTIDIAESKIWRDCQLDEIRQWRTENNERLQVLERGRSAAQIKRAITWLLATEGQEDVLSKRSRKGDSREDHWVSKESAIVSWSSQMRNSTVVWLSGKPGAGEPLTSILAYIILLCTSQLLASALTSQKGKSVICSKLVGHIQAQTDIVVIYYFCSYLQASLSVPSDVLRNFATQLLQADSELAP